MEDYEKKYKEALNRAREIHRNEDEKRSDMEWLFPELKESEDEKIRKALLNHLTKMWGNSQDDVCGIHVEDAIAWLEKQGKSSDQIHYWTEEEIEPIIHDYLRGVEHYGGMIGRLRCLKPKSLEKQGGNPASININKMVMEYSQTKDGDFGLPVNCQIRAYRQGLTDAISTLNFEKQGNSSVKWQKNTPDNKPAVNHSILMKTIQGIAEGEWQGEHWFQYRWSWTFKDSEVLAWMELSDLDEQGEQKPAVTDFNAKDWYISKVDGKIHDMTYNPADKVEPRFKVKYAGSEYNVLEVKDIAGVTFYGIEDEPNHIDYVKAENCEIISGYAIKENGSPYPTKPAVFSEKNPAAWSDEDENYLQSAENACEYQYGKNTSTILWLKHLKDRIGG